MKRILNEYDSTKKMLNTLRKLNLTEQIKDSYENDSLDDIDVINDVDIKMTGDDSFDIKLQDQQRNEISNLIDSFREQVSQTADLDPGLSFNNDQIRLDGKIEEKDLKFVFISGRDSGLYLNAEMLKVDKDIFIILEKLIKFQEQFNTLMDTILRDRQNM